MVPHFPYSSHHWEPVNVRIHDNRGDNGYRLWRTGTGFVYIDVSHDPILSDAELFACRSRWPRERVAALGWYCYLRLQDQE
jgi:hypothetical protein